MSRAVVLGGIGLIGRATARRLLAAGWEVTVAGRDASRMPEDVAVAGGRFVAADRGEPGRLAAALGAGRIWWPTVCASPPRTPVICCRRWTTWGPR